MPNQIDNLMLDDDTTGLPRTINTSSDDIILSVDLTLQSGGILTADNIKRGTADPNAGGGTAGNEGDIYQRTLASTGELYVNTDGTNTGWELVVVDATGFVRRDGTTTLTGNWAVGNFDITGVATLGAVTGTFSGNVTSGNALNASVPTNFGPTPDRYMQAGTTTSTQTAGYKLYVNEGSRNTRVSFFLTDAATSGGGWGHWLVFGSGGFQPYVVGMASTTLVRLSAPGDGVSSFVLGSPGSSATSAGQALLIAGGVGGSTSNNGGALTTRGGAAPTSGTGGAATHTTGDGAGGNNVAGVLTLTVGASFGSGTAPAINVTGGSSVTGTGSAINVTSGAGGSTSGASGAITLLTGTPVDGNAGNVNITGAAGVGTNRSGGSVLITSGAATGAGTAGEVDLTSAGLMDMNAGANLDIDVTGTFDMLSTGAFSIDGTGASNVSATSGNLTLSTLTSGTVIVNSVGIVDIDAATSLDILAGTTFSIDGTGASNVSATSGNLTISTITSGTLLLTSAGLIDMDAAANIDIDVTGSFDVLATGVFSIDGTGASNVSATSGNLTISTITSGTLIEASAGAIDIDAATTYDMLSGGAFSIDGTGASNVSATSGNLTISTITSGTLIATSAGLWDLNAGANLDIDVTGNVDILATTTFSIDGTGASNLSATSGILTISTITSGDLQLTGADAVVITAGNEAAATGNLVSATGGSGGGNNPGGAINLTGGTGGAGGTSGVGGAIALLGGTGGATGAGGAITVTGGAAGATSGNGGAVTVTGGTATDGNGGAATFSGAAGVGTNRSGGILTLAAGAATGNATGALVTIGGGQGGATGTGGAVLIGGGAGGSTSGNAGAVTLRGGAPIDGNGGAATLQGRDAATTTAAARSGGTASVLGGAATVSGTGGAITVTAGAGGTTGTAGTVTITGGAGGSTSGAAGGITIIGGTPVDGAGGAIAISGSAGVGTNRAGGGASFVAGNATGNATGGAVAITAGSGGATGTAGTITLTSGAGGSTSGAAGMIALTSGTPTSGARGVVRITNTSLEFIEQSSVQGPTIAATQGRFWVRNDSPNVPIFTDDTGTDHNLLAGGTPTSGDWKESVRVATTASIALSGEQTIDGVSVVDGDRVLVKDQDAAITTEMVTGSSELSSDSATFVDANCSSSTLSSGDWFAIGFANHRNNNAGSSGFGSEVEARIGSTRFAVSSWNSINGQFNIGDDAAGGCLSVFARVTSSGSDTLNMRARALENTTGENILVGSQAWIYFNIGNLAENTDYWAAEAANSDSAEVTPNGDTWTDSEQLIFTPTETGDYLIMASAEGFNAGGVSLSNEYWARLRMNGATIGTETEMKCDIANFGTTTAVFGPNFTMIDVRTLTASVQYTINWQFQNAAGQSSLSYRRSRIYVFRLAAFVDSEYAIIANGIQASNEIEECSSTLSFNFGGSPVTAMVLAGCDYANGGAWGSGWLRRDGTPDVDYPPDGRMWAVVETGLGATNDFMPLNFGAVQTGTTGAQVYRLVGQSEDTPTITFGRTRGNGGNSRMVLVAIRMENTASASQNGIYDCSTGAWSRSADANTDAEVTSMLTVGVEEGTMNGNTFWYLATMNPIVLNTTALVFAQLGATAPGSGLTQPEVLARISLGF